MRGIDVCMKWGVGGSFSWSVCFTTDEKSLGDDEGRVYE